MKSRLFLALVLVVMGAAWGMSLPFSKIAVSTGHQPLGLVVWQLLFGVIVLLPFGFVHRRKLSLQKRDFGLVIYIAVFGTLVPSTMWFLNAQHLPAGILAIVISLVPMVSLPIAIAMRLERFVWVRLFGVLCGAAAIGLLIGPETSLPDPSKFGFVLLALIGPICYGIEGNIVAKFGLGRLDPIQVVLGASIVSLLVAFPVSLAMGQGVNLMIPWGAAEWALLASSVVSTLAYVAYVWLVGQAGSVFAAQVSYLVTGFGVLWSIVLLSESYSGWVWAAMGLMFVGLFLVQPNKNDTLEEEGVIGDTKG